MIVLTSTSYVGTTRDLLVDPLAKRGLVVGKDIFVAFSPERIDPGNLKPHEEVARVVGGVTPACLKRARTLLEATANMVHPVGSPEAAELTKLYENTFRAVNIAFANEMADIARELGVDILEVIEAASTKPYGFMPFYPGPGVGGHCIPCDPHYLRWQLSAARLESPIIEGTMAAIARRPRQVVSRLLDLLGDRGIKTDRARVLVYGVAYKPGVEDARETPATKIIEILQGRVASVEFFDPLVGTLTVAGGQLVSVPALDGCWDMILVHTLHGPDDIAWLSEQLLVLDATYNLPIAPNIERL